MWRANIEGAIRVVHKKKETGEIDHKEQNKRDRWSSIRFFKNTLKHCGWWKYSQRQPSESLLYENCYSFAPVLCCDDYISSFGMKLCRISFIFSCSSAFFFPTNSLNRVTKQVLLKNSIDREPSVALEDIRLVNEFKFDTNVPSRWWFLPECDDRR